MASKTRVQLAAEIAADFPDNTSGAITPALLRGVVQDVVDSSPNIADTDGPVNTNTQTAIAAAETAAESYADAAAAAREAPLTFNFPLARSVNAISFSPTLRRTAWVSSSTGNDATAVVGASERAFATILAAHAACVTAGGNWIIRVGPGTYTDVGLTPGTAGNSIYYYYERGATHQITGASNVFNWTGNNATIEYVIWGHARFIKTSDVAGTLIGTSYSTSQCARFTIEAELIHNASTGFNAGPLLSLSISCAGSSAEECSVFRVNRADTQSGTNLYFRIGGALPQVWIQANIIRGIHFEQGTFFATAKWFDGVQVGLNDFAVPQVVIVAAEKLKGTDQPALDIRTGWVRVEAGNIEVTNAGAHALRIRDTAATSSGIKFVAVGVSFVQRGGTSSFKAIRFDSVGANIQVRLVSCSASMENGTTPAITASGAITVDIFNGFSSNVTAGDGNVTFRGSTPVVEAGFYTGFWF
jgi:hypothetical protein